jgi:hypothetical protein
LGGILSRQLAARLDPALSVRVVGRQALRYDAHVSGQVGAAWVRAGSALARFGKRLMMVQDDALWLAWWDELGVLRAEPLPADGTGPGQRLFDDKRRKPDFEAAVVLGERLFVFGSGSLSSRERVAVLEASGSARIVDATELYAALRGEASLAGRQLNIEGALLDGSRVVLYSRGNGAALAGEAGFDASVELDAAELERYLAAPRVTPLPTLGRIEQYRLGSVDSVRLTLTDAAVHAGKRYYVAAAEASPDAIADGPVVGTSFGVLDADPRYSLIEAEDGSLLCDKVEGLAVGESADEWLAITDPDDTSRPAELLVLRVAAS